MPWLFSYGSNHLAQLQERIGSVRTPRAAVAHDWARVFRGFSQRWQGGVATLVPRRGKSTFGYIARLSEGQLDRLDRFEGVGLGKYKRVAIGVTT